MRVEIKSLSLTSCLKELQLLKVGSFVMIDLQYDCMFTKHGT